MALNERGFAWKMALNEWGFAWKMALHEWGFVIYCILKGDFEYGENCL